MQQDPPFGFRQLVDIAERGLSPAVNDPTTAVQVLDELHDLLRRLVALPFPTGQRTDEDGKLRLAFPVTEWESYVRLAVDEIRQYGADSIQVTRRLKAMLGDLAAVAPPHRVGVIRMELDLVDANARRWPEEADRRAAAEPDPQGLGS